MSGHSKWSTIKRAKGAADSKRSAVFGKLSKKISIAAREGASGDPAHNFKLRIAIDKAKEQSMPNDNIDRAIKKGLGLDGSAAIEEIIYEGYGPYGVAMLIETATDNSNRTVQLIKHALTKNGGSLGAVGSVAWQFQSRGQIFVAHTSDLEAVELTAIDAGATDVIESDEGLIIYTKPEELETIKQRLKDDGVPIEQAELVQENTQPITLTPEQRQTIDSLIELLEDNEDVIAIHAAINE